MKEQIEASSKSAIDQVKANNISAARIEWIQKLRPLLAEIISIATKYSDINDDHIKLLKEIEEFGLTKETNEEKGKLLDASLQTLVEYENVLNQIKLYLNLEEERHADLVEALDAFLSIQINKAKNIPVREDIDEEDLIDKSRIVLKEAWEQAKNIK